MPHPEVDKNLAHFASLQSRLSEATKRVETHAVPSYLLEDFGFFTPNSANATFSYLGDENDGGTLFVGVNQSGSYSVGSNGRTTFSNGQNEESVLYLVAPNKGFVLFTGSHVMTGFLEQQIGAPYTNASLQGTYSYGIIDPGVPSSLAESGTASFDAVSNVTGAPDDNLQGTLTPGQSYSMSYSVTVDGKVSIPVGASAASLAYVVSPTRFVLFPLVAPLQLTSRFLINRNLRLV
jgi:hypothetical protein